jgi:hypothetical protein
LERGAFMSGRASKASDARQGTETNWRDRDTVSVGWSGRPELGAIVCDVLKRDRTNDEPHGVALVSWCKGKPARVSFCHSEERYTFQMDKCSTRREEEQRRIAEAK